MAHDITRQLAELNPDKDYEQIALLLQCWEFPWDYEKALEFALFRTRYEAGRRVVPGSDRAGRFHVALFAE
jgi:hypothetical protein